MTNYTGEMNNQEEMVLETTEGFVKRNAGAVGAAAGVGVAGYVGGFFTGKYVERKKNDAIMEAIVEEINHFNTVVNGSANEEIYQLYDFENAYDIKFKILEKLTEKKTNEKTKEKWRNLLDLLTGIMIEAEQRNMLAQRTIVSEQPEETV